MSYLAAEERALLRRRRMGADLAAPDTDPCMGAYFVRRKGIRSTGSAERYVAMATAEA